MLEHSNDIKLDYNKCSIKELRNVLNCDIQNVGANALSIENIHLICTLLAAKSNGCKFEPAAGWLLFEKEYLPLINKV